VNNDVKAQILMIDDDENDAMLIRYMVGKMPDGGCQFDWAGSYDHGLRKLSEIQWDLCLVDYHLGSHTGVDVVRESRARGVNCPFLLLTGDGSRAVDLQAMRAGVRGYLEKSRLCPLELERAIRYAIGNSPVHKNAVTPASQIPADAVELLRAGFTSKQPFVVIALMIDRESILRTHLSLRHIENIQKNLVSLIRTRISPGEALFQTGEGAFLLVSSQRDMREARQFISPLLSEPLAISCEDRSRTISLAAVLQRGVFPSHNYAGPVPLVAALDVFVASCLQ
jgi:DNA-binding NarL/FixJ family response regulator